MGRKARANWQKYPGKRFQEQGCQELAEDTWQCILREPTFGDAVSIAEQRLNPRVIL